MRPATWRPTAPVRTRSRSSSPATSSPTRSTLTSATPAKPFFKEVQIKGGGDATQAARAVFQTGESDYSWNLQVEAQVLNQLMQGGRGELITAVSPNVERLLINFADPNTETDGARAEPTTKHPFLTDLKVRQALAMAVDRKSIAEQLYGPTGQATCNIVTTPDTIASKNTANMDVCKFDIAKANQLLDEAGWTRGSDGIREKAGVKMRLVYQTTVNPLRQREQDIVKAGWEQLGVGVELKAVQAGVFFSTDVGNPDTAAKFYTDVEMFTNGAESPDPTNYLASWTTKEIASKSNEWRGDNYHRYSNPEFDAMYEQLLKETDTAKRNELCDQDERHPGQRRRRHPAGGPHASRPTARASSSRASCRTRGIRCSGTSATGPRRTR